MDERCFDICRDVMKLLTTKQFYGKSAETFLKYPGLHAKAIEQGFKAEKISRRIEAILKARVKQFELPERYDVKVLSVLSDKIKHAFKEEKPGYEFEEEID